MPDGKVQWFDARTGEGRIVRGGREYPLRAEDAEPAARHPGARLHFDIRREEGSERAVNATLPVGTRVSRRQRRFGDLSGARTADAKGPAPFTRPYPDLAREAQRDPLRVARQWAHRMESGDLDAAPMLYAPDAEPPRPTDERQVVRRKAFAPPEATLEEAAFDLKLLDHDFYLFREPGVGGESLLVRHPDGRYRLLRTAAGPAPVPPDLAVLDPAPVDDLSLDAAIERMNATGDPFVSFRHRETGRGNVIYWRYDGHYGLIEPPG